MSLLKYFNVRFFTILTLMAIQGAACKKEVHPNQVPGAPLGQIVYLNVSEDLKAEVAQATGITQYSYVLVDYADTNYQINPMSRVGFPFFYQGNPIQYPAMDTYNQTLPEPWIKYDLLAQGSHNLILTDTAHHGLLHTSLNVPADTPVSVFFMDNAGKYQAIVAKDVFNTQPDMAGLRVIHASPDAGAVFFTINHAFTNSSGFPDSLKYGNTTAFIQRPVAVMDTVKLRFYSIYDSTTILSASSLIIQPGHAYTFILAGYNQPASYVNPYGSNVSISADLGILLFKNN